MVGRARGLAEEVALIGLVQLLVSEGEQLAVRLSSIVSVGFLRILIKSSNVGVRLTSSEQLHGVHRRWLIAHQLFGKSLVGLEIVRWLLLALGVRGHLIHGGDVQHPNRTA